MLYLTDTGGPTLITNQKLGGDLADKGWLVYPSENRLTVFEAEFLHGVIPGSGVTADISDRRITFMVGFWDSITIQEKEGRGASRRCPKNASWLPLISAKDPQLSKKMVRGPSTELPSVWQSNNGAKLTNLSLPHYDLCYQGF